MHNDWTKYCIRLVFILGIPLFLSACDQDNKKEPEQKQEQQQEGDGVTTPPAETPTPSTPGGAPAPISCVVASPRYHMTNARTIANLDGDYANTPYRDGANLLQRFFTGTFTHPGIHTGPRDQSAITGLAALAGPGAVINSNLHLFYVEFPVNSTDLCVPKAWETGESWVKGVMYEPGQTGIVRNSYNQFTKKDVAGAAAIPGTDVFPFPASQWIKGTGRGDANFPEAWIFIDGPGLYASHVGQTEAGNYVNIRLNIRDGSKTGAVKGTAIFRIAQRLHLNGTFTSRLGGSSGAGSDIMDTPPVMDPGLDATTGLPANPPASIPSVFGSHPDYVGNP